MPTRAVAAPSAAAALQRRIGQQGAQALISRAGNGPPAASPGAMRVSSPADASELEAESTAKKVMRSSAAPVAARDAAGAIARKAAGPPAMPPNIAADIAGSTGLGAPLPARVLNFMEPRFKADFSRVRIHTGPRAAQLSSHLNARAFTVGNNIFFARDQFKPETPQGQELIAHELTHTIQQGSAVQRSEAADIRVSAPAQVQRNWLPSPIEYAVDKASLVPGFRMLTLVLEFNPINMARVARSAANLLRALLELLPGGALLTEALSNRGVLAKAGARVEQKVQALGMAASSIKLAIDKLIGSLGPADILDLAGVWDRAKHIVTAPIDRIIDVGKGLMGELVQLVKDAMLQPLARLAEKLPNWQLLTAVLGKNPITGEPVARRPDILIGGFMKLIGQDDVWENMKKANAVARAWTWFQGAMAAALGFVRQLPTLAVNALKSLTIEDIVLLPRAFGKVAVVFGSFAGNFIGWAGTAVWHLLEIVFDAVSPGAFSYIKGTGAALRGILKNPLPFVGNLVKAAKLGFLNFAGNFLGHLRGGLMDWLLGALPGVYTPKALSLGEIVKFAFSVLGIGWQNIRQKLVKAVGEPAVAAMETGFDAVKTLVRDGPAAAWEMIKEQLADMKDKVIGGITDFVVDTVVKKAVPKLVAMFIPGAGFISAIVSVYDTVMVFVDKLDRIAQVVKGFTDSIVAIAGGAVGAAAGKVEGILGGLLSLAINFMAGFAGLGKVADKVMGVIGKVRGMIDKALDALIRWIVNTAKKLFVKAFDKKDKDTSGKVAKGKNSKEALDVHMPIKFADEAHTSRAHLANGKVVFLMASGQFSDMRQKLDTLTTVYVTPLRDLGMTTVADDVEKQIDPVKKIVANGEQVATNRLKGVTDPFKQDPILKDEAKKTTNSVSAALEKMRAKLTSGKLGKAFMGIAAKIKPGAGIVNLNPPRAMVVRSVKKLELISNQYEFVMHAESADGSFKTLFLYRQEGITWSLAEKPVFESFKSPSGLGGHVVIDYANLNTGGRSYSGPPIPHLNQTIGGKTYAIRGHLVACVFAGPARKDNIVAITRTTNEMMRSLVEVRLAKDIRAGAVYRYAVYPIYLGGNAAQPVIGVNIDAVRIYPDKQPKKVGFAPIVDG